MDTPQLCLNLRTGSTLKKIAESAWSSPGGQKAFAASVVAMIVLGRGPMGFTNATVTVFRPWLSPVPFVRVPRSLCGWLSRLQPDVLQTPFHRYALAVGLYFC